MKFDSILEYQKIDQELIALETEVTKSKERSALFSAKGRVDEATGTIGKLSSEAAEIISSYQKLKDRTDKLQSRLEEFNGVLDGIADINEAEYYLKQIETVVGEISALEKDASKDSSRIDTVGAEYKKTWEAGTKALDAYKRAKVAYDSFIAERQPRVAEIKARLDSLKKEIPEELFALYSTLRSAKQMPAFVEYDQKTDGCRGCFMDIPNDTKGKLKVSGDYTECPNCRRILFLP